MIEQWTMKPTTIKAVEFKALDYKSFLNSLASILPSNMTITSEKEDSDTFTIWQDDKHLIDIMDGEYCIVQSIDGRKRIEVLNYEDLKLIAQNKAQTAEVV